MEHELLRGPSLLATLFFHVGMVAWTGATSLAPVPLTLIATPLRRAAAAAAIPGAWRGGRTA
ncbi:hypothetical protein ACFQX4_26985 [Roseomonas sp. GCM10028921]